MVIVKTADCQLPVDSLMHLCLNIPCKGSILEESKGKVVHKEIGELYKGYFKTIKLFYVFYQPFLVNKNIYGTDSSVGYSEHSGWTKYYSINVNDGRLAQIQDYQKFNAELSKMHFGNLDKCYLYLLFNFYTNWEMTNPEKYPKRIIRRSLLVNHKDFEFFTETPFIPAVLSKYNGYFTNSTERDLNVGVLDRIRDKSVYKIYNFKFDNKTQLTNCSVILVDTTCCP